MISLSTVLFIYLFGGLTFPLVVVYALFIAAPNARKAAVLSPEILIPDVSPDFKVGAFEEAKGVKVVKKGWLSVTTKYYYHATELQELEDNENLSSRDKLKKKHHFYALLKHGNLFLYRDDSADASVAHVIVLKDSFVSLWPRNPQAEAPDGSLYTKKMCIAIFKNGIVGINADGQLEFATQAQDSKRLDHFFLYVSNNIEKEDWYFALINASKVSLPDISHNQELNANVSAETAHFPTRDMLYLIQTLNSNEGQATTKWLNAILGRLFLGLQQTEMLSEYLRERLYKKLTKINKPGFLDDLVVERVDAGNAAPIFTHPSLKEITPNGLTKVGFQLFYKGNLSLIISTKATINLGSRFKTREVTLQLSITVKEITGPMLVIIKPPPSNRIWYSFETEPYIDLDVEPIVSTKQLSYNMVTNAIKSKFREAIKESLVMPFMDDIPFHNTTSEFYRGGVWEHAKPSNNRNDRDDEDAHAQEEKRGSWCEPKVNDSQRVSTDAHESHSSSSLGSGLENYTLGGTKESGPEPTSIRQRTLQKVETFKSKLKTKAESIASSAESDESEEHNMKSRNSFENHGFLDSDDTKNSKNYFNAGMKKVGKWYKGNVSNSVSSNDDATNDFNAETQSDLRMISNRRTLPKAKEREFLKSPKIGGRRTSDAAEMFAKSKQRSTSINSSKGASMGNNYSFSHTPPHSPLLPNTWPNQETNGDNSSNNTKSHVNHGEQGEQPSTITPEPDSEAKERVRLDIDSKAAEGNVANEIVEDYVGGNEAGEQQEFERPAVVQNSQRVCLQELNRRRPVPPLRAYNERNVEKEPKEKISPALTIDQISAEVTSE
ncbi:LANO_0G10462g1_1 [Lachancea nothofagi CBS 11611]|uniref:LANO_0G10462g1_1 n=1 Tax=Lachancea nothofagi CBS 11611 TaxID=1266666 RepID=A0A1G4KIV0_9SACH|nr:LANO_0G10462g1_1 [Lachancea nothofagi CBS 11611]